MTDYLQPDFYRFNQDSLALISFIKESEVAVESLLDLGAGCGVIGIELARFFHPKKLTLVEVQEEYRPFLKHNKELFLEKAIETRIFFSSFGSWEEGQKYELITCNPPYYLPGHGEQSQNRQRGIARSFLVDDWKTLLSKIACALSPNGKAYLVVKKDERILKEVKMYAHGLSLNIFSWKDLLFLKLSSLHVD